MTPDELDDFMAKVEKAAEYVGRREFYKAITYAKEILRNAPNIPELAFAYGIIGTSYHFLGNNEEAIRWLKKAIEVSEGTDVVEACARAHDVLGVIYSNQGKWEDAVSEFKRAVELMPWDETYKNHLNQALQNIKL